VFLLNQTLHGRPLLAPVGTAREAAGERAPGLVLSWDHVHADGVQEGAAAQGPLAPMLADPGVTRFRRRIFRHDAAPWVARGAPESHAAWDALMNDALAWQRDLGTELHILPSMPLSVSDWPDGLHTLVDATRRAHRARERDDPDSLLRLSVSDALLHDERHRRTLLDQITDLPERIGIALHVRWARASRGGGLADDAQLSSMALVVRALAGDDRRVLMIESGLLGWLSLAWGAWGCTAGLAQATWHRSTETVRRRAGQPAPQVAWYFESQLLHFVRRAAHNRMSQQAGYAECDCAFCIELRPTSAAAWDQNLAKQHALYRLAELTDRVAAPQLSDRRERVRAAVERARDFTVGWSLRGEDRPSHVDVWLRHL